MDMDYNRMELMISLASRFLEDNRTVVVGPGAPCAAAMLAQSLYAPNLMIMFEAGGMGPQLPVMPISVGDSRTFFRGLAAGSMAEIMENCQRGIVDYTFLGGAQIDMYGNINSTMIGSDYERPKVRFPGSGGACDLASFCWRIMVITVQDARRFTNKINFITSPGYLTGKGAREAADCPAPGLQGGRRSACWASMKNKRMQVESITRGYQGKIVKIPALSCSGRRA